MWCFEDPSLDLLGCIKLFGKGEGIKVLRFSFVTPLFYMVLKKNEYPDHLLTVRVCAGMSR